APQLTHQANLALRLRFPWPVALHWTSRLAVGRVAQVRRDAAEVPLEILDRVERRGAGEAANGRVQSAARKQQQREPRTSLLIVDANRASLVKLARVVRLLSEQ